MGKKPSGYVKIAIEAMAQSTKNRVSFPIKIAWWIFPVRFNCSCSLEANINGLSLKKTHGNQWFGIQAIDV